MKVLDLQTKQRNISDLKSKAHGHVQIVNLLPSFTGRKSIYAYIFLKSGVISLETASAPRLQTSIAFDHSLSLVKVLAP